MGEVLGLPEWLAFTLFLIAFVGVIGAVAWRNTKRQISATLERRPNLTKSEFLAMMQEDVSFEASEFVWDNALSYLEILKGKVTPHPDDNLLDHLPIDEEEWSLDWPRDWAENHDFHESNMPDWPHGWPITVRNYGRWLDMGSLENSP